MLDYKKVHPINLRGSFSVRVAAGTLLVSLRANCRSCRPEVRREGDLCAAEYADRIIAIGAGIEGMKSYRDDVLARAKELAGIPMISRSFWSLLTLAILRKRRRKASTHDFLPSLSNRALRS